MRRNNEGVILPAVLIFLVAFAISGMALVDRFGGQGKKEMASASMKLKHYSTLEMGVRHAQYTLLRPDNPALAHTWTSGYTNSYTLDTDGRTLNVLIEDVDVANNPFATTPVLTGFEGVFWHDEGAAISNALEGLIVGDFDGDGLSVEVTTLPTDGVRTLFYLGHKYIHKIESIELGGVPLALSEYAYDLRDGWITFKNAHAGLLTVRYQISDDLDIITGNIRPHPQHIYFNDGNYNFTQQTIPISHNPPRELNVGDMDGDDDLDIVYTTYVGVPVWLENNGDGTFQPTGTDICSDFSGMGAFSKGSEVADFDNDGDMDVLLVDSCESTFEMGVYFNDGAGNFTNVWRSGPYLSTNTYFNRGAEITDLDNDGDLDFYLIVFDYASGRDESHFMAFINRIADGDPSLFLLSGGSGSMVWDYTQIEVADMDGDGDLDVMTPHGQISQSNANGMGFGPVIPGMGTNYTTFTHMDLADIDGDGDIDLLGIGYNTDVTAVGGSIAGWVSAYPPVVNIYLNDGSGGLTELWNSDSVSDIHYDSYGGERGLLADMNGDGLLNVVTASHERWFSTPGEEAGVYVYGQTFSSTARLTKVTSTLNQGGYTSSMTANYLVNSHEAYEEPYSVTVK